MRVNPVLPLPRPRPQTARSVVDLILNARSADDLRQYGWEKGQATSDGRFRWKGTDEHKGQYRTQKTEPGTGRGGKKKDATAEPAAPGEEESEQKPSQKKPATPRKPKVDHNEIGDKIEKMLEGDFSDDDIAAVKQSLMGLTVAQLGELKKRFGVKGGRTKADIAGRIGGNVEGKRKPAEQPAPSQPAEPQQAQVGTPASEVPGSPEQQAPRLPEAPQKEKKGQGRAKVEPWQMTPEDIAALSPKEAMKLQRGREEWMLPKALVMKGNWGKETAESRGKNHRITVENALTAGKPVPPEVLADYPDLAQKYSQQPAAPAPNPREQRSRSGLGRGTRLNLTPEEVKQIQSIQPSDQRQEVDSFVASDKARQQEKYKRSSAIKKAAARRNAELASTPVKDNHEMTAAEHAELNKDFYPADISREVHKRLVKSALASGKQVPPEVLADYPDLQRNRAGLGKAHALVRPKPASVMSEPQPRPAPSSLTRNRLTAGVRSSVLPAGKPQGGADADREARIEKYRQRAAQKKPLFNSRSPVDMILNARNPHQARPLLYAWVRRESKRRPGRFYWQNADNPRDKLYQDNMPGQRPGKHTPVASVDPREHLLRVLEAPYKVADYYLTSLRERLQRMRPAAVEALRQEFSSIV